jgi:thymidine kinase
MVIKINTEGNAETEGAEIKIGGNDLYKSVCRKHFRKLTKLV